MASPIYRLLLSIAPASHEKEEEYTKTMRYTIANLQYGERRRVERPGLYLSTISMASR